MNKQTELYEEMEAELRIMESTFLTAGLCVGNLIGLLESRAHELREEEQKDLAAMNVDPPVVSENEEHRLGASQLL